MNEIDGRFIMNKYTKIYLRLIERAKRRQLDGYYEKHHIVPRSLGGSNKISNLARLTGREHFICHLLLTKMTKGDDKKKMIFAARYMIVCSKDQKVTNKRYEKLREEHRALASQTLRGRKFSAETKAKMSIAQTGNPKNKFVQGIIKTPEHCANISKGKLGKSTNWSTPENRQKVSDALRGRSFSEDHRKNLSEALKGKPAHNKGKPSPLRGITLNEETKAKMRKPKSEEMKQKLRETLALKRAFNQTSMSITPDDRSETVLRPIVDRDAFLLKTHCPP